MVKSVSPEASKLKDGVCIVIIKTLVVGPLATNCYIVGSESTKVGMIIDPGDDAEEILRSVKDLELDIKFIVLTHGHLDHSGALKEIKETIWAEIALHSDEFEPLYGEYPSLGAMFGLAYPPPPCPDRFLKDGDSLDLGDLRFSILHTPGHTPGGISLLGEGVVFTGDTLFNCGVGRTDLPSSSHDQLMDSLSTKLMVLPDDTIVYPGHGPQTTIGAERSSNPYLPS